VKVVADRDVCIGSGNCVFTAPDVFDQGEDGLVVLLEEDVDPAHAEPVRQAVAHCPSAALRIVED
jgi:ferredoxin